MVLHCVKNIMQVINVIENRYNEIFNCKKRDLSNNSITEEDAKRSKFDLSLKMRNFFMLSFSEGLVSNVSFLYFCLITGIITLTLLSLGYFRPV